MVTGKVDGAQSIVSRGAGTIHNKTVGRLERAASRLHTNQEVTQIVEAVENTAIIVHSKTYNCLILAIKASKRIALDQ